MKLGTKFIRVYDNEEYFLIYIGEDDVLSLMNAAESFNQQNLELKQIKYRENKEDYVDIKTEEEFIEDDFNTTEVFNFTQKNIKLLLYTLLNKITSEELERNASFSLDTDVYLNFLVETILALNGINVFMDDIISDNASMLRVTGSFIA